MQFTDVLNHLKPRLLECRYSERTRTVATQIAHEAHSSR